MSKRRRRSRNLSNVSIREARSQNVLSDAYEHEKAQTAVIDIEGLRNIGRIVRAIKQRIDPGERDRPGENVPPCPAGDPRSSTDTGANRGQNINRESAENG